MTHNTDGTVDFAIDPVKFRDYGIAQAERVLNDLRSAKASGLFPVSMLDELEKHAVAELDKMKNLPIPTGPVANMRLKK